MLLIAGQLLRNVTTALIFKQVISHKIRLFVFLSNAAMPRKANNGRNADQIAPIFAKI
jgi:hypothetical protein